MMTVEQKIPSSLRRIAWYSGEGVLHFKGEPRKEPLPPGLILIPLALLGLVAVVVPLLLPVLIVCVLGVVDAVRRHQKLARKFFLRKKYLHNIDSDWRSKQLPVCLEGAVGQIQKLWVGDDLIIAYQPKPSGILASDWTWLGQTIATEIGVELLDERDLDAMERWDVDPCYRAHLSLQQELFACKRDFPDVYSMEPVEPSSVRDHNGVVFALGLLSSGLTKVSLTLQKVDAMELNTIDEVVLLVYKDRLELVVRVGRLRRVVVRYGFSYRIEAGTGSHLRFVEQELRQAVLRARPLGDRSEVPEALGKILPIVELVQ